MEIGLSKNDILSRAFEKDEINGLYEIESSLINSYYILGSLINWKTKHYLLKEKVKNGRLFDTLIKELEISNDILNKRLHVLSSGEYIRVLILKACLSNSKSILLNHIDANLSFGELNNIMKTLRRNLKDIDKTIILSSNSLDNIVPLCTKYIVLNNADVDYAGTNIEMLPVKTEIMKFIDRANDRKAKMSYYKDPSDLLKAIYRSVKK